MEKIYAEAFAGRNGMPRWRQIHPVTKHYLRERGMSDEDIVELHQTVWDLSQPFMQPLRRQKFSRSEAREIKRTLEHQFGIEDYSKPLEGEPEHSSYGETVEMLVENPGSWKHLLICGAPATGKTVLAKRIKHELERKGVDAEIYDETVWRPDTDTHTIRCIVNALEDDSYDTRLFVQAPLWRRTVNAAKRFPFQITEGILTTDTTLLSRYSIDFQKTISDIVTDYAFGRVTLPYRFIPVVGRSFSDAE